MVAKWIDGAGVGGTGLVQRTRVDAVSAAKRKGGEVYGWHSACLGKPLVFGVLTRT